MHVQRQKETGIDVLHEATIDDYWNVDEDKSLSEPWIGVTRFELLNKNPPRRHMWSRLCSMIIFVPALKTFHILLFSAALFFEDSDHCTLGMFNFARWPRTMLLEGITNLEWEK